MNAKEGIDMTKMAVVVMTVSLVISAIAMLYYFASDQESQLVDSMEKATLSAQTERLYQLQEQSETADVDAAAKRAAGANEVEVAKKCIEDHPLVTTVSSVVNEYNEDGLLYIYIVPHTTNETNDAKDAHVYTYTGVSLTSSSYSVENGGTSIWGSGGATVFTSDTPKTAAMKELLMYSQYRCHVHMVDVPYGDISMTGIVIEILTV